MLEVDQVIVVVVEVRSSEDHIRDVLMNLGRLPVDRPALHASRDVSFTCVHAAYGRGDSPTFMVLCLRLEPYIY